MAPADRAAAYVVGEVTDVKMALEGARDIIAEGITENADLLGRLRSHMRSVAMLRSRVVDGKQEAGAKFSDYFDHTERWSTVPGHRALAMLRGWNEEFLSVDIDVDLDDTSPVKPVERTIAAAYQVGGTLPGDKWLMEMIGWTWRVKLSLSLSLDLMRELRERSEEEAIHVFARNLKDLLLAAPAGSRATMGLDPGIRTGVKVAVIDGTGKLLETTTVYPFPPKNDIRGTQAELASLDPQAQDRTDRHRQRHGQPRDRTARRRYADAAPGRPHRSRPRSSCRKPAPRSIRPRQAAADEFPGLDVSLRGAVSIARRLQDPLAELVKIEPKSIGVGQYQHDVDQARLGRSLEAVVEDAVNAVGVDLNTASAPLLARVSGLGKSIGRGHRRASRCDGPLREPQGSAESAAAWRPRPSSNAPASCASPTARSRSMPPPCIRKPMAWPRRSLPPAAATCAR